MKIRFAQLHSPLFFAGVNFGDKLDVNSAKGSGLKMLYDRNTKELNLEYKGKITIMPTESNVVHMEPGEAHEVRVPIRGNNGKPIKAQVQVPIGLRLDE